MKVNVRFILHTHITLYLVERGISLSTRLPLSMGFFATLHVNKGIWVCWVDFIKPEPVYVQPAPTPGPSYIKPFENEGKFSFLNLRPI